MSQWTKCCRARTNWAAAHCMRGSPTAGLRSTRRGQYRRGSTHITLTYQPSATDVEVRASIRADRFDYGILARRIKPDTDLQGLFSLQMDIEARAPTLDALMQHANGRIDFAVWPHNFKAGIFDLWAVNLAGCAGARRSIRRRSRRSTAPSRASTCATAS